MTIINDINLLRPAARAVAVTWLHIVRDDLAIDARLVETLRQAERQADLALSSSSPKVGWHMYGLAWDYGVYINGVYQKDDRSGLYKKCGMIGMALGCRWGGNWDQDTTLMEARENDLVHLEYHPGTTLQQFLATQPPPTVTT